MNKIVHNDAIANDNIELTKFYFDADSAIDGLKQQTKDKTHHHVIRIGVKNAGWHSNITKMLKDGINTPPPLANLSLKQRNFARSINRMTLDTIIDDPDLYDHAMREAAANKEKAVANITSTCPTRQTTDVPTSPEGVKRRRIELHSEFYMLQNTLGDDVDLMGNDAGILLDKLMSQLVALKQRKRNDKLTLLYKSNGKHVSCDKVPVNNCSTGFNKSGAWLDKTFGINGSTCTPQDSVKRTVMYIKKVTTRPSRKLFVN